MAGLSTEQFPITEADMARAFVPVCFAFILISWQVLIAWDTNCDIARHTWTLKQQQHAHQALMASMCTSTSFLQKDIDADAAGIYNQPFSNAVDYQEHLLKDTPMRVMGLVAKPAPTSFHP